MFQLKDKNVLLTGASGLLGRHLLPLLRDAVGDGRVVANSLSYHPWLFQLSGVNYDVNDLRRPDEVGHLFDYWSGFDLVVHLAGYNGGLAWNLKEPARIFHDNTVMAMNLLEACRHHGVKRFVGAVTSCGYPDWLQYPEDRSGCLGDVAGDARPEDYLRGRPHPSVACHGYAKRNLLLACQMYRQQYGLDAVNVCMQTLFGPGDRYDPERSKFPAAMVKRFCDAAMTGAPSVTCWGDGLTVREVLYAPDAARLFLHNVVRQEGPMVNLGPCSEVTTGQVAKLAAQAAGYEGHVYWDATRPGGQKVKRMVCREGDRPDDFVPTSLDAAFAATAADYLGTHWKGGVA